MDKGTGRDTDKGKKIELPGNADHRVIEQDLPGEREKELPGDDEPERKKEKPEPPEQH